MKSAHHHSTIDSSRVRWFISGLRTCWIPSLIAVDVERGILQGGSHACSPPGTRRSIHAGHNTSGIRTRFRLGADWPDAIDQAARHGYVLFAELLHRRTSVLLAPEDETLIDWVLDAIRARLKFLERFCRCNLPN